MASQRLCRNSCTDQTQWLLVKVGHGGQSYGSPGLDPNVIYSSRFREGVPFLRVSFRGDIDRRCHRPNWKT